MALSPVFLVRVRGCQGQVMDGGLCLQVAPGQSVGEGWEKLSPSPVLLPLFPWGSLLWEIAGKTGPHSAWIEMSCEVVSLCGCYGDGGRWRGGSVAVFGLCGWGPQRSLLEAQARMLSAVHLGFQRVTCCGVKISRQASQFSWLNLWLLNMHLIGLILADVPGIRTSRVTLMEGGMCGRELWAGCRGWGCSLWELKMALSSSSDFTSLFSGH